MESINTDSEQILDLERGTCVTTEESTGIVALELYIIYMLTSI